MLNTGEFVNLDLTGSCTFTEKTTFYRPQKTFNIKLYRVIQMVVGKF